MTNFDPSKRLSSFEGMARDSAKREIADPGSASYVIGLSKEKAAEIKARKEWLIAHPEELNDDQR